MKVCTTRSELAQALADTPHPRALVMTMGALHEGHGELLRAARSAATVVASVYVNPLQFGPNEDYEAYPRPVEKDLELLAAAGVDVVFMPSDAEVYPRTPLVRIDPGPVAKTFEGASRPGHFAGVLQVVHKVFNLVKPDLAYFGQKDAQQLALIKTMVADLNMDIELVAVPIVRDSNGLALSSRNTYLSPEQYQAALAIPRALAKAESGQQAVRAELEAAPGVKLDYLAMVDPQTFIALDETATSGLMVVAAWVGTTRLIDNMEVGDAAAHDDHR